MDTKAADPALPAKSGGDRDNCDQHNGDPKSPQNHTDPLGDLSVRKNDIPVVSHTPLPPKGRSSDGDVGSGVKVTVTTASHEPFTSHVDSSFNPSAQKENNTSPSGKVSLAEASDLQAVLKAKDGAKLKQFLRKNSWPACHPIRKNMWLDVCRAVNKDTATASIYQDELKSVFGEGVDEHLVNLPTFVDPVTMEHFHLTEEGTHTVKRIICILGTTCPDITYAPFVFSLTSLLLHYMEEEDCYNCMYGLLRSPQRYLSQTKVAQETTKYVLKGLAKKYAKSWHTSVSKRGLLVEGLLDHWMWWLYHDLPFQHFIRVIDCFLYEGPKVIYRVGLTILILFHKHIANRRVDQAGFLRLEDGISQFCEDIPVSPDKLLKIAFGIRGLSRQQIGKLIIKEEMYVRSMRHTAMPLNIHKSESVNDLKLKVSRSFSGPVYLDGVDAGFLAPDQKSGLALHRTRSSSHGAESSLSLFARRCQSSLLDFQAWQILWGWIPTRITLYQPKLLYTTSEHGTSLTTFYGKVDNHEPTLIVLKTTKNEIFGAYCSSDWVNRMSKNSVYFGTGESFVFSLAPDVRRFQWVGLEQGESTPATSSLFMQGTPKRICIGGGAGVAFQLDEQLFKGRSEKCATYNNLPLAATGDFQCSVLEAFGFE